MACLLMCGRPADLRGAKNAITDTTMLAAKKAKNTKPPPTKKAKTMAATKKKEETEDEDTYHFIGYVPPSSGHSFASGYSTFH